MTEKIDWKKRYFESVYKKVYEKTNNASDLKRLHGVDISSEIIDLEINEMYSFDAFAL
jgi:hypothetical protein